MTLNLNNIQKGIVVVGLIAFIVVGIVPPHSELKQTTSKKEFDEMDRILEGRKEVRPPEITTKNYKKLVFRFVWNKKSEINYSGGSYFSNNTEIMYEINVAILGIMWGIIIAITYVLALLFSGKREQV